MPAVPFGILYETLKYFNRRELVLLSEVTNRFHQIVEKHFGKAPYLRFAFLYYSYKNGLKWFPDDYFLYLTQEDKESQALDMSLKQSSKLPTTMYLRFHASRFIFNENPMALLNATSHLWQKGALSVEIVWDGQYGTGCSLAPSTELIALIWNCHSLWFEFDGCLTTFTELLRNNNLAFISFIDKAYDPAKPLPLEEIMSFLFKIPNTEHPSQENHLAIQTKPAPNTQNYVEIVRNVREKFFDTWDPSIFNLTLLHTGRLEWNNERNFVLDHCRVKKRIHFEIYPNADSRTLAQPSEAGRAEVTGAGHTDTDEGILMAVREAPLMRTKRFLAWESREAALPS
ncbi:hypothetical protein DdX_15931 [Ditylenchus destructor]|uniref:F-box domain-containing protein n=1 Tax=Ditylenchus destructor TaxID=166010 RepID=A0AAD4MR81_9BILA|nr:hypothetical protein DdX_15931 [Ditylenchus destructor]